MIFIDIWIEIHSRYILWESKKGLEYMSHEYFTVHDKYAMEVKRGDIGGTQLNIKTRQKT